ncbi:MAG: class I SAM-dependent methyltransferase [Oscillospiraceae bacterium]|nr:class I SAM-dependent methyltransferase [Oscillospiraceae bacterium]
MNDQNIYDNPAFFEGYRALREKDSNLNDLLEQPAMAGLLPDLNGKSVLDLGCGYGRNCVDFVRRGAARVVGLDISEKMLAAAREESRAPGIEYIRMSMTELPRLRETFDFIYSSLAFHYVEDFPRLAREIYRLLNPGGCLLFSQEHPIVTAAFDGKGGFNRRRGRPVSYTFSNYSQPGRRVIHWIVDGVVKYHRPMGEILTALAKAGFVLEEVCEPVPEDWAIEKLPSIVKEYLKPNFLIVKARKTP